MCVEAGVKGHECCHLCGDSYLCCISPEQAEAFLQGGHFSQKAVGLLCPVLFTGPQLVGEVVLSCIQAVLQLLHEH